MSSREKVTENMVQILKRNGDFKKIRSIIKATEKIIREKNNETKVLVESADTLSETEKTKIKKSFLGPIVLEEKKDETLLAGKRITINDEIFIDTTARREINTFLSEK